MNGFVIKRAKNSIANKIKLQRSNKEDALQIAKKSLVAPTFLQKTRKKYCKTISSVGIIIVYAHRRDCLPIGTENR